MNESEVSFKFPFVDPAGTPRASGGMMGAIGFSEKYTGTTREDDALIVALRTALSGHKVDAEQSELLRSFTAEWLIERSRKLGSVVGYAVELDECISFLSQIGFLERTATGVGRVALGVASLALTWDWIVNDEAIAGALVAGTAVDGALSGLSLVFESKIDKRFGKPGSAMSRASFDVKPILIFLQCCHMRAVVKELEADERLLASIAKTLDTQIYSLFMLNSRQLEGLSCSGASEATAAVAAYAAIALGLKDLSDLESLLSMLDRNLSTIECSVRQNEASNTLTAIRNHSQLNTDAIQRQLNRQLVSAATTEALDLAVTPLRASLHLMGLVAGGMESIAPGHYGMAFAKVKEGCNAASSAANSTPDVLAAAFEGGISAEAWARQQFDNVCGFLLPRASEKDA